MLSRTLSRTEAQSGPRRWRPFILAVGSVLVAAIAYLALPDPGPRVRPVDLSDDQVRALVGEMTAPPPITRQDKALADLGRRLFHDTGLSDAGRACAGCHVPDRGFSDGMPRAASHALTSKNTPTIVNTYLGTWFNWDGRSDSLVAQAVDALEDPRQLGSNRVRLAREIASRYTNEYEAVFGALPSSLQASTLPVDGAPPAPRLALPIDVAAYALKTLGSYDQMRDILSSAQAARRAPAHEVSVRAFGTAAEAPIFWVAAYEALAPDRRAAVDQILGNFGLAVAAYERGLGAVESPFDHFARRLAQGGAPRDALGAGFGEVELQGLRLFAGPARCAACHSGPGLSDQQFHNIGLDARPGAEVDTGRAAGVLRAEVALFPCAVPTAESCRERPFLNRESPALVGAFKTPSLRNVTTSAPYMHDGRFATLAEVLDHYDRVDARPAIGEREGTLKPLGLTYEERAALEAFLAALAAPVKDYGLQDTVSQP